MLEGCALVTAINNIWRGPYLYNDRFHHYACSLTCCGGLGRYRVDTSFVPVVWHVTHRLESVFMLTCSRGHASWHGPCTCLHVLAYALGKLCGAWGIRTDCSYPFELHVTHWLKSVFRVTCSLGHAGWHVPCTCLHVLVYA